MSEEKDAVHTGDHQGELASLLNLLDAVDQEITPGHVEHRFHDLLTELEAGHERPDNVVTGEFGDPASSSNNRDENTAASPVSVWPDLLPGPSPRRPPGPRRHGAELPMTHAWNGPRPGHRQALDAVHRTILVVDISASSDPVRRNSDRVVMRMAMYDALATALRQDWPTCYREDRGDGVLVLVPPNVPKSRLVTSLPERLEAALARHNVDATQRSGKRGAATQVRLRVAVHAGEVTFDRHGVVGAAIDHTFRLVDAPPLKAALTASLDSCMFTVSDWFYSDVVYHHQQAMPDAYRRFDCEVKGTKLSAWLRVPVAGEEPALTSTSA